MDAISDPTDTKQRPAHLWKPGQSGNVLGRPRGSRNRLGEDFVRSLADDFERHGVEAIKAVRERRPDHYLKVIASLLPRGVELDVMVDARPELKLELAQFISDYKLVKSTMAKIGVSPTVIDAIVEDDGDD
jgi:hypothetical protein